MTDRFPKGWDPRSLYTEFEDPAFNPQSGYGFEMEDQLDEDVARQMEYEFADTTQMESFNDLLSTR